MRNSIANLDYCLHSYDELELAVRTDLDSTALSYREISAIVGWNHTQIWAFHKQNCKLQFEVLEQLALLFHRPFIITNGPIRGQKPHQSMESLENATRKALSESLQYGISYRKIGQITGISHEWVRCFHAKGASIDIRKLMAIADYLGVYYELSNEKDLRQGPLNQS